MEGAEGPALEVDVGPPGLAVLKLSGDLVQLPILDELCPRLLEEEGHPCLYALLAEVQNPLIPAGPGVGPGFPAGHHLGDLRPQPGPQVDGPQQGLAGNGLVADGGGQEEGQAEIRPGLVLCRGADAHVFIARAPVWGEVVQEAVDALGDEEKV